MLLEELEKKGNDAVKKKVMIVLKYLVVSGPSSFRSCMKYNVPRITSSLASSMDKEVQQAGEELLEVMFSFGAGMVERPSFSPPTLSSPNSHPPFSHSPTLSPDFHFPTQHNKMQGFGNTPYDPRSQTPDSGIIMKVVRKMGSKGGGEERKRKKKEEEEWSREKEGYTPPSFPPFLPSSPPLPPLSSSSPLPLQSLGLLHHDTEFEVHRKKKDRESERGTSYEEQLLSQFSSSAIPPSSHLSLLFSQRCVNLDPHLMATAIINRLNLNHTPTIISVLCVLEVIVQMEELKRLRIELVNGGVVSSLQRLSKHSSHSIAQKAKKVARMEWEGSEEEREITSMFSGLTVKQACPTQPEAKLIEEETLLCSFSKKEAMEDNKQSKQTPNHSSSPLSLIFAPQVNSITPKTSTTYPAPISQSTMNATTTTNSGRREESGGRNKGREEDNFSFVQLEMHALLPHSLFPPLS